MNDKKRISDIAASAEVSPATVSRVFNRHPYVKDEIRHRVLEVARRMKYSPKFSAARNNIGIVLNGYDGINLGQFEVLMVTALSQLFFKRNYAFEIIPHTSAPLLHNTSLKGLIAISPAAANALQGLDIPMITVNHEIEGIHSVSTDHRQGLKISVDYFFAKGHRKIAYIGESPGPLAWGMVERMAGYCDGLAANGLDFDPKFIKKEEETLLEASARIVKTGCTAVIVGCEGIVPQFCYMMYLMNKSIPADISTISFETASLSQYMIPPQTTIDQNFPVLAETVVTRLDELIAGKPLDPVHLRLENRLIERESVFDRTAKRS
ncbi:MAG: LacI family DNA-binding transcriptional regulator [Lentisphaerota bacterium]